MKKLLLYNGFSNVMLEVIVWMIYLKEQGWSVAEIAFLEGLFTIAQAAFEFPAGVISDRIGHKAALLMGETVCILYLTTYFFPSIHWLIYLGMILFALGLALISGTDVSLVYETVAKEEQPQYLKALGYFNFVGILAMALGNAAGGIIASYSWSLLFGLSIEVRVLSGFLVLGIDGQALQESSAPTFKSVLHNFAAFLVHERRFRFLVVAMSCSAAAVTLSYQYGPLILQELHFSTQMISVLFGLLAVVAAGLVLVVERLTRFISAPTLIMGLQILSLGLFAAFLLHNHVIIVIGLVVINIVFEMWHLLFENQMQTLTYEQTRASAFSLATFSESVILTVGSALVSLLTTKMELVNVVSYLGMFLLAVALLSLWVGWHRESK
ncbi:MFS transporter [Fructilactobacillus carniphilus]|uniref:MFS transporter n=1 Tax=Fructilactobacillus carniphilus TaxID=2940297 RepID=A0ABY5BZD7_9LACO|nr:MFS transporter [Fructilactobacillus carniphilus]USS90738.1 MFS transporter [Fructilactobacillus carniphilus]